MMLLSSAKRIFISNSRPTHLPSFIPHPFRCSTTPTPRNLTLSANDKIDLKSTKVLFVGEQDKPYGSREYILLQNQHSFQDLKENPKLKLASIRAHRNMIFAANVWSEELQTQLLQTEESNDITFTDICGPLVDAALVDAHSQGEQPQALSAIPGLCHWVSTEMIKYEQNDESLQSQVIPKLTTQDDDSKAYDACKAIATKIPRPGHSIVGVGTYRDGEVGWKALAKEFIELGHCHEATLYKSKSAELATIEHLAHKEPEYLESAGGAMA
eukprot:CAMPEP_0195304578 /NCGR_PEP_ID=MMETSP0707-20130614/34735_1 /TAXON_ID=33640 /ORGANISM="Asterionellopsis glacialis, Strain CCMP134" /LENGTH=269 /DNA_ID=CAMNT_0040368433 /DNA_START=30 /DNA_END=836 /DNA_ORIENTATION=+